MSSIKKWLSVRGKWALIILMTIIWVFAAPFMLLAIGFSGGSLIDPLSLIRNTIRGDVYALDQLVSILFVFFPVFLIYNFVILTRSRIQNNDESSK
jgi:hypothetical protein